MFTSRVSLHMKAITCRTFNFLLKHLYNFFLLSFLRNGYSFSPSTGVLSAFDLDSRFFILIGRLGRDRLRSLASCLPLLGESLRITTTMKTSTTRQALLQASLFSLLAAASPAPTAYVNNVAPRDAVVTPSPTLRDPSKVVGRDILSDVESDVGNILSGLGSDLPSWVASGVPNFFQGVSCLHLSDGTCLASAA